MCWVCSSSPGCCNHPSNGHRAQLVSSPIQCHGSSHPADEPSLSGPHRHRESLFQHSSLNTPSAQEPTVAAASCHWDSEVSLIWWGEDEAKHKVGWCGKLTLQRGSYSKTNGQTYIRVLSHSQAYFQMTPFILFLEVFATLQLNKTECFYFSHLSASN